MSFTMQYSAHPERRTAFETMVQSLGLIHGRCQKGCPWQNGIIERSHRTDNEEVFKAMHFASSEERRYQHRLWEMFYNTARPHQGLDGLTPQAVYFRDYRRVLYANV